MRDSTRLQILKLLTTHLETIRTVNGYQHDLVGKVFRGRATFGTQDPLPAVTILEALNPDREPRSAGNGLMIHDDWVLLIQGWTNDGPPNAPTDPAHLLMADVKMALGQILTEGTPQSPNQSYMLGGAIADLRVEPGTVRPPDESSARSYFYLRAVVGVAESLKDPYAAAL